MAQGERRRFRRRMGYMRKVRVLGHYVRVDEHGREGEAGDKGREGET